MTSSSPTAQAHEHHHNQDDVDIFGFWLYILSDCILFATLFTTFAVLQHNTFGGPALKALFNLPYVLAETLALLFSSFTYGIAMICHYRRKRNQVLFWLGLTFILGVSFVAMELNEFASLYHEGHGWQTSAAMSSFFTLVGTHGLHVSIGLFWMLNMMYQVMRYGINGTTSRRLTYLGIFWHFLDIVWIFLFTIVYLMGAV